MTILAVCAAFLVGISLTAGAATADPPRECATTPWTTEPIMLSYHDLWTYTYEITWCAENGRIVWVEPAVTYEELDPTVCVWRGNMEERVMPDRGGDTWTTFIMSEFACRGEDGTGTRGVTPWAEVMIYPDGRYVVLGKDIAE